MLCATWGERVSTLSHTCHLLEAGWPRSHAVSPLNSRPFRGQQFLQPLSQLDRLGRFGASMRVAPLLHRRQNRSGYITQRYPLFNATRHTQPSLDLGSRTAARTTHTLRSQPFAFLVLGDEHYLTQLDATKRNGHNGLHNRDATDTTGTQHTRLTQH